MATDHSVQQGEHLSQIAERYGFRDYETIWNHPKNAQLRELRKTPNVLFPGDIVHIPDKEEKKESRATGKTHPFVVRGVPLFLHLALRDFDNEPLADTDCTLEVEGKSLALKTDGDGRLKAPIPRTAKEATLTFKDPLLPFDLTIPIKIGHLDPVSEPSGQKARLSNLGYITRPIEDIDDKMLNWIIQEFQCDFGLPVTGACDAATQAKLKEVHGS